MSYYYKYTQFFGSIYLHINSDESRRSDVNILNVCKIKIFCFLELIVFSLWYAIACCTTTLIRILFNFGSVI